ncbi:Putative ribonuclease H protein At1g65750 [Linum perenne]
MSGDRSGIRDGKLTSFWSSKWLDSGISLEDWADRSEPEFNPLDCVADFVTGDEGWDVDKLNKLLHSEIVEQVVGRSPPRDELGPDAWIWGDSYDGRFTIKSAYKLIYDQSSQRPDVTWDKVWKWEGPCRIKFFLWLAIHERLLTNSERVRRHLAQSAACSRCGDHLESVSHALRDCSSAASVWDQVGFDVRNSSWGGPFAEWMLKGINSNNGLLFGVTVWMIWKSRDEFIFSNSNATASQIGHRSVRWTSAVTDAFHRDARCFGDPRVKRWESIAWEPGPEEWITINTDGSFLPSRRKASAGGIIRSCDGHGLVAFTMNLGVCTITRAEIRGAIAGLAMAWEYGFRRVELQLDSQVAISLLTSSQVPEHQHAAEVLHFQNLCRRDWIVNIRHIFREANKMADFLASRGYEFPFGIHLFPLSDCNLGHFLRYDCLGISETRLVTMIN